jgi:iron complex outermembrane receptor protein
MTPEAPARTPDLAVSFAVLLALFTTATAAPIPEIVVTAERRENVLQKVPIAVSALDESQLANRQIVEATDLQRVVPSLKMFNNITSPTNLSLSLRGGLQQDASLVVAESPVGVYVDDIYVGRLNGNNITLSDIQRVEVLRGPQGTLYGRNTGYGAVKYVSRTPGDEPWADGRIGLGNYDQIVTAGGLGGPLSDEWAASIAAQWKSKSGQFTNVATGEETGDEDNFAVRGKLRFMPADNLDVILSGSRSNANNDSLQLVNGITPAIPDTCSDLPGGVCDPGETTQFTTSDLVFPNGEWAVNNLPGNFQPPPLRNEPQGETTQDIVGLTIAWDLNEDLTFKSITGYVGTEDYFHTDFSGNSAGPFGGFVGATDVDSDQLTQELQLLGTALDDRLNYIVGAFYLHEEADQQFGWFFATNLSQSFIDTEVDSWAVFGEAGYNITEKLKVTAGLRYTDEQKDFRFDFERFGDNIFNLVVAPGFFPALEETVILDGDFDETTPKLGIDYQVGSFGAAENMLLYAQAAKGYKGGGFSAIALVSTFPVGAYDPETNWTYEGGLKADWLEGRLRTNLAYFYSDIEDIQQNATDSSSPSPEFPVQNSGDATIQGLEIEITAVPVENLNLFISASLMDGEYDNLDPLSAAFAATALYGVEPQTPQTPDYTISIGADYTFPVAEGLTIGADYYEIDDYVTAATNDFKNDGWDIWNAFVSLDINDNVELKFTGKNLADDFIITAGSRGLGGFIALPRREFLFSVNFKL